MVLLFLREGDIYAMRQDLRMEEELVELPREHVLMVLLRAKQTTLASRGTAMEIVFLIRDHAKTQTLPCLDIALENVWII
jgi:hypothetical protein